MVVNGKERGFMDQEMLNKRFVIYGFENTVNHKIYVGQTTQRLRARIDGHKSGEQHFDKMLKQYGIKSFYIVILEECSSIDKLNERETYWIKRLNCKEPNGYNLTDGGLNCIPTSETRQKMSAKQFKRAVLCVELNIVFESLTAAANWAGVSMRAVRQACEDNKQIAGFHWRFLGEARKNYRKNICCKAVRCVETGEIFSSIKAAAEWVDVVQSSIGYACRHGTRAGTYHWEYVDSSQLNRKYKPRNKNPQRRAVRCIELDMTFESTTAAAAWVGVNPQNINEACKNPNRTIKGHHWEFTGLPCVSEEICKKMGARSSKQVICVETGIIYPSVRAASEAVGTSTENIAGVCRGRYKTAKGYHWCYVTDAQSPSAR